MAAEPRVLVVIASANRRGAELEGVELAMQLSARGTPATAVALAPSTHATSVDAEVIGVSPMARATLRALRHRAKQADVVIAYGSTALPACSVALLGTGVPFIYRSIGDPGRWVRGGLHRLRTGILFHRPKRVVALWPAAADSISRLYRVRRARIDVIPNARDATRFTPATVEERASARRAFGVSEEAQVVAFIGAMSEEKRPHLAVQAVVALAGVHLLIAGDGPERASAEHEAKGAPGRIHFLGSVEDVLPVLHAADVVVSTSRTEGMPGSLIEAALCGLPIVATDVGAVSEVVSAGRGSLVSVDAAPATFAAAIKAALDAPGHNAGGGTQRYTWETVVLQWQNLLRSLKRG